MTDRDASDQPQPAQPDAALKRLGRLVGTWQVSGEAHGTVTYAWMEGGFFLIQHVDLGQAKGIEIIGRERGYGRPSRARTSSLATTAAMAAPSIMCTSWRATP